MIHLGLFAQFRSYTSSELFFTVQVGLQLGRNICGGDIYYLCTTL